MFIFVWIFQKERLSLLFASSSSSLSALSMSESIMGRHCTWTHTQNTQIGIHFVCLFSKKSVKRTIIRDIINSKNELLLVIDVCRHPFWHPCLWSWKQSDVWSLCVVPLLFFRLLYKLTKWQCNLCGFVYSFEKIQKPRTLTWAFFLPFP